MKKFASIVILGSVLSFTALQAKAQADSMQNIAMTQKVASVSQDDMNMLFDNVDSSKVAQLDSVEMSETKGEFLGVLTAFLTPIAIAGGNWVADRMMNYWFK